MKRVQTFSISFLTMGLFFGTHVAFSQEHQLQLGQPTGIASLPSCSSIKKTDGFDSLMPAQAVFLSCGVDVVSCLNAAKTISDAGGGVDAYLLYPSSFRISGMLGSLPTLEKDHILFVPTSDEGNYSSAPKFLRDVGLPLEIQGVRKYIHLPYINMSLGYTSTTTLGPMMNDLKIETERSYATKVEIEGYISKLQSDSEYKNSSHFALEQEADIHFASDVLTNGTAGGSMGGNFLALPGSAILYGISKKTSLNPVVHNFLAQKGASLEAIPIPESLTVGHIDEVFSVISNAHSNDGECKFALLMASPSQFIQIADRYGVNPYVYDKNAAIEQIRESEQVLEGSSSKIAEIVKQDLGCNLSVVRIPAFFASRANVMAFNPVNGLELNGTYFYSAPSVLQSQDFDPTFFDALKRSVADAIEQLGVKTVPVSTRFLDQYGGNLHCGTIEVRAACKG